ncbi:hypothetical protein ABIB80_004167 [Bradyrhizobium sp. i1.15.2]|uniref:hypothetical protein n=1 Tax=Bradyrhizobium sp. i1.15.2 TaxID=3156362 RepID=UPI0033997ED6
MRFDIAEFGAKNHLELTSISLGAAHRKSQMNVVDTFCGRRLERERTSGFAFAAFDIAHVAGDRPYVS